ncbi:tetratricopeptide repeat protein [Candidatus Phycorickettsia trachydisci]|nr:tetratricopeptide repeat protein [Candidatus Phycorickettsia trachydisci]
MKAQQISQINGIIFTPREVDIISCITNVRGMKKIADILGISPRTVEGYVKNILTKISSNSQESIKDFVERSSGLLLIRQHYIDLLINKLFLSELAKLAAKLKNSSISCIVSHVVDDKLGYIVNCLKLANVNIIKKPNKFDVNNKKTIVTLTEKNLLQLKEKETFGNVILICFDKRVKDGSLEEFSDIKIIDCFRRDQIYSAIFKIIELLAPNIDISVLVSDFNKHKNNIINFRSDVTTKLLDSKKDQDLKDKKSTKRIIMITLLIIAIAVILSLFILGYTNYISQNSFHNISVNFLLPSKKILLERKEIQDRLGRIFAKSNEINTAVLVGVGGSGKTTIARNFARNQKASIIWELNAETKNSLSLSLEGLAYALCNTNADKQELRNILDIKDLANKNKQLLIFTQKQLKSFTNWLIIYDNVESFKDICEYFPHDRRSWGNGRVIITTRDATIKNNNYLDNLNVINIEEISKEEKLELFKNITGDASTKRTHDQEKIEQFLDQIPSFPLDVSIAAHYLKDTGMEYGKYLEEIGSPKKEFSKLQSSILQDVNQYTKTRYNIVSLTLKKMMQSNKAFSDLALLIALLDSQDIPEELLVLFKDQYVASDFLRSLKKNSLITNIKYKDNAQKGIDNLASFSIHRSTQINILADIIGSLSTKKKHEVLSVILNNIQSYILKQIDLEDSAGLKNFIRHCETLSNKQNLLDKEDLVSIDNALGIIYYYLGNDKQAQRILKTNLDINKQDEETALILTHLGAIYRKIGQDYQTAIEYLKRAVEIYNIISLDNPREGLALTHLGNTYRTLGDFQNAIEALQKSVNIYHKQPGYYAGEARALGYLGVAYREQGNLVKAKDLLEEAISLYNKGNYPKYSSVYAGTLAHLAITYRMMKQYDKAKGILKESVEIYKQIRPENHPDIGRNILNLGIIYGEIKNNTKAKELLEKSLNDYENNYGKDHIETGKVLNHLGRFYILAKNYEDAEMVLKRASNILQQNSHPESYRSFELLGDLYMSNIGKQPILNKQVARINYDKSLKLALKYFLKDSLNVKRIKGKVEDCIA